MNEELNKKLAEWAGLEVHMEGTPTHKPEMWEKHGSVLTNVGWIEFTQSLDACFKWLEPKAVAVLTVTDLSNILEAKYKLFDLWMKEIEKCPYVADYDALALCLAIEKLIDGGNHDRD